MQHWMWDNLEQQDQAPKNKIQGLLTCGNSAELKVHVPCSKSDFELDTTFFSSNHFFASMTALLHISGISEHKETSLVIQVLHMIYGLFLHFSNFLQSNTIVYGSTGYLT